MPSVAVCYILKDEAKTIERSLDSVKGFIDKIVVCDTGSTDSTIGVVNRWADANGIPAMIFEREWVNFGQNRSELLELVSWMDDVDFCLLLDADMTATIEPGTKESLWADGYNIGYTGPLDWKQKLLVRNQHGYRYVGVTHEYIMTDQHEEVRTLDGLMVTHHGDGGSREDKYKRDYDLLVADMKENPGDIRTMFYLARTEECLGMLDLAAQHYRIRSQMPGWEEEGWYAQYTAAKLQPTTEGLLKAWERRPERMEPLFVLGEQLRQQQRYSLGLMILDQALQIPYPKDDVLFIDRPLYEFRAYFEWSICAYYAKSIKDCEDACHKLLTMNLPFDVRARVEANLANCLA